jgi:hypothetical protein
VRQGDETYSVHDVVFAPVAADELLAVGGADNTLGPADDGGLGDARGARRIDEHSQVERRVFGTVLVRSAERLAGQGGRLQFGRNGEECHILTEFGTNIVINLVENLRIDEAELGG